MKKILLLLPAIVLIVLPATVSALPVIKGGKSSMTIVYGNSTSDSTAAAYLNKYLKEATGIDFKTMRGTKAKGNAFLIATDPSMEEDSFEIKETGGVISITGAPQKGTIYGAFTFLEKFLEMDWYSGDFYVLPKCTDLEIPDGFSHKEVPSFRYRQTAGWGSREFTDWNRLESPQGTFAGGLWVHTMNSIMPSSEYGESHPEYYAYINGERRPGRQSSWCLTNPDVLEIATHKLDSIFKKHPDMNIISVSQNDGNNTNCKCDKCRKLDEENGGPSGSLIWFVNQLAERFPDKQISTLAYLHTMNPPTKIKPRSNVNIMLCNIDCTRELPLTDTKTGQEFMRAMEGWAKISDNIFLWDYAINFHHMMSLFPNFHILSPNINLAKKNGVTMMFEQTSSGVGTDLADLRVYLLCHLMWNHKADVDALTRKFCKGFYGEAAPYIYDYIKLREGALIGSGNMLWIYDSPAAHAADDMRPFLRAKYIELFDKAEAATAADSASLAHVRIARLAIQYSELEILRTLTEKPSDMAKKVDMFEERCNMFKVRAINEGRTTPKTYIDNYRKRYLPDGKANFALTSAVEYLSAPAKTYDLLSKTAMTDGLFGGGAFRDSWIGWVGNDPEYIVDLGKNQNVTTVSVDFLQMLGDWVFFPYGVSAETSLDGKTFTSLGQTKVPESHVSAACYHEAEITGDTREARYVKIKVDATKKCPNWHFGVGHDSWCFIDETRVR